jgi:hypothetical protein
LFAPLLRGHLNTSSTRSLQMVLDALAALVRHALVDQLGIAPAQLGVPYACHHAIMM